MKILAILSLLVVIGFSSSVKAQTFSHYHINTLYDAIDNPQRGYFEYRCKKVATNLFIPNFDVNTRLMGQSNKLFQGILFSENLNDIKLDNNRKRTNQLIVDNSINIFTLKILLNKEDQSEFFFNVGTQISGRVQFKNDVLNVLTFGNGTFRGETLNGFFNTNSDATAYAKATIGYRRNFSDRVSGGVSLSILNGAVNRSLLIKNSSFRTEETTNGADITMKLQGELRSSEALDSFDENQIISNFTSFQNSGYEVDLGVNYDINEKLRASAAFKDFGQIFWNNESYVYTIDKEITFKGISLSTSEDVIKSLTDSFEQFISDTLKGSYITNVPAKAQVSIYQQVFRKSGVGLIISKPIYSADMDIVANADLRILGPVHTIFTLGYNTSSYTNLGAGLLYKGRFLEFFLGSEQLLNVAFLSQRLASEGTYTGPTYSFGADVNFGFAIRVGRCSKKVKGQEQEELTTVYKDTDGDGVLDNVDRCPNNPGSIDRAGCPYLDSDNDGIIDLVDDCPYEAGTVESNGCPNNDFDRDGVLNRDDECPNEAGPINNNGCPYEDMDGDGVLDIDDKCPTVPGPVEHDGCPEPKKAELNEKEEEAIRKVFSNLRFETGSDVIAKSSYSSLDKLSQILLEKSKFRLLVEGHTDNVGSLAFNKRLSQKRADSVKKLLLDKGIADDRLVAIGYGPDKPVGDNTTPEGRSKNRRVEFTILE